MICKLRFISPVWESHRHVVLIHEVQPYYPNETYNERQVHIFRVCKIRELSYRAVMANGCSFIVKLWCYNFHPHAEKCGAFCSGEQSRVFQGGSCSLRVKEE